MTVIDSGPVTTFSRFLPLPRPARSSEHPAWCVHHGPSGCLGQPVTLPGSRVTVWLSATTSTDPRLVIDGPGGTVEVPVEP
jgi:hypothetical protein